MTGAVAGSRGLIDSSTFPFEARDLDVTWLEDRAMFCRRAGAKVKQTTDAVHDGWGAITEHYQAPEAPTVYRAMNPVRDRGEHEQEVWFTAARHIDAFALELAPLKRKLASLALEADVFRNKVASGVLVSAGDVEAGLVVLEPAELAAWYGGAKTEGWVAWHQHKPSIERNEELVAEARTLLGRIETARQELEQQLRALRDDDGERRFGSSAPGRFRHGLAGIGTSSDLADIAWFAPDKAWIASTPPDQVRAWWDDLSPWQQQALIAHIPLVIGNLNGIPLGTRVKANELNLRHELTRLERELATMPDTTWNTIPKPQDVLTNPWISDRDKLRQTIQSYKDLLTLPDKPPRDRYGHDAVGDYAPIGTTTTAQLVAFDPANEAIATYNGPLDDNGDIPDWIRNVVTHVPGTTTESTDFNNTDELGYEIYEAASDLESETGVVTWMGGHLPLNIATEAPSDEFSRDLGPKLVDFVDGVKQPAGSTLTVTGHSYGAAVVGMAEANGLKADRVIYMAPAGLGNDNTAVADFPHTGDKLHATIIGRYDGVTGGVQNLDVGNLGHGPSPQDDPDVHRLETGWVEDDKRDDPGAKQIDDMSRIDAHSAIYETKSTSFKNLIGFITGSDVELYAPDRSIGFRPDISAENVGRGRAIGPVDGIDHPDYEPDMVSITDLEADLTRKQDHP